MKIYTLFVALILSGFTGCEIQNATESFVDENSTSKLLSTENTEFIDTKAAPSKETLASERKQIQHIPEKITKIPKVPIVSPPSSDLVKPVIKPKFSKELLQAVDHWKKIPKSVFPLKNVGIQESITFELRGKRGKIMATLPFPAGKEVVVKSILGEKLLISPTISSNLVAKINIEDTDFKECVAFRFEMGKKIIEKREMTKKKAQSTATNITNKVEKVVTPETDQFLVPGDFGHGKFCVCSDCRQKRLAITGSIK